MCYRPISIKNQARHITRGMPFEMNVPCGKCPECQRKKSLVYHLRTFYEAQSCFEKGGYIYSVCLTYEDAYLPHVSDFTDNELLKDCDDVVCFGYPHFRLFMVSLRQFLSTLGYDVSENLRYFVASEFGKKNSCRPHYHLLLFCSVPRLTNNILSACVAHCWRYGYVDGLSPLRLKDVYPNLDIEPRWYDNNYKNVLWVNEHTYTAESGSNGLHSCIEYVTKYVEKQQYHSKFVDDKFASICERFNLEKGMKQYAELKREYYKYCSQFHRQSLGYGLSALAHPRNSLSEIMRTGVMIYYDAKGCVKKVTLSQYYARKLFYELVKSQDGKLHWHINENGVLFKMSNIDNNIIQYSREIKDLISNYANDKEKDYIYSLLGERSLRYYATYVLCYKGRVCDKEYLNLDDYTELFQLGFRPHYDDVYYNYQTSKDRDKYGSPLVSCVDLHHTKCSFKNRKGSYHYQLMTHYLNFHSHFVRADVKKVISSLPFCMTNDDFKRHVVSQSFSPAFEHFDTLFNFLASLKYKYSESFESAAALKSELKFNFNI